MLRRPITLLLCPHRVLLNESVSILVIASVGRARQLIVHVEALAAWLADVKVPSGMWLELKVA